MTTLYKPVLIESAEQAEALPVGTTVTHPDYWPREKANLLGSWEGPGDAMQNVDMVGWTALVPIEAEEEVTARVQGFAGVFHVSRSTGSFPTPQRRLVTPWEAA